MISLRVELSTLSVNSIPSHHSYAEIRLITGENSRSLIRRELLASHCTLAAYVRDSYRIRVDYLKVNGYLSPDRSDFVRESRLPAEGITLPYSFDIFPLP
jgi:hypothetical protein